MQLIIFIILRIRIEFYVIIYSVVKLAIVGLLLPPHLPNQLKLFGLLGRRIFLSTIWLGNLRTRVQKLQLFLIIPCRTVNCKHFN